MKKSLIFIVGLTAFAVLPVFSQETEEFKNEIEVLRKEIRDLKFGNAALQKSVDDILWYEKVGDIAYVDKVRLSGPPRWKELPPKGTFADQFAGNKMKFYSYVFIPLNTNPDQKYPLVVFAHSGIHNNFSTISAHIVRELVSQGYIVVAPEYRGSTGYGETFYNNIDYGGLENEDAMVSRDYMVENYAIVDPERVGIIGWSHGGMISMMNVMHHPQKYNCAFAGVPVSDLLLRLSYKGDSYLRNFTADYHIGETVEENRAEYERRSPITFAAKLEKPLMITSTTNDDDVSVEEVRNIIRAFDEAGKGKLLEYTIYEDADGGHSFDRMDSKDATDIRFLVHKFLEKHLSPPRPFKDEGDMREAGYRFR